MQKQLSRFIRTGVISACCALTVLTAGCGSSGQPAAPQQQENKQEEAGQKVPDCCKTGQKTICIADDQLSNLQLIRTDVPVYDSYTVAERRAKGLPLHYGPLHPSDKAGKVAYLTFDDGPDTVNTPAILDILQEQDVPATFYVLGARAELHPDIIKRIYNARHALGNHSYDHDYDNLYPSVDNFVAQLEHTDAVLQKITGMRPLIVRAPGGKMGQFNEAYEQALRELGYVEHDWNVSSADTAPGNPTAQDFIDNITFGAQQGMPSVIVLMHCSEGHEETVKALPGIIQALRAQGYSFGVVTPMTPQPW